ncbi:MAG: hypothetical protein Kow0010_11500 [Dehalococcoidia bacterium]
MHLGDILTTARIERRQREARARHAAICRALRRPGPGARAATLLRTLANRLDSAPASPLDLHWLARPRGRA